MDGTISLYLGLHGSGKTTAAREALEGAPRAVVFSPDIVFEPYPRVFSHPRWLGYFTDPGPRVFRVDAGYGGTYEAALQALPRFRDSVVLIDDYAALFTRPSERLLFSSWLPLVRRAGQRVIVTAHLSRSDTPRRLRTLASEVRWYGPLADETEARLLYGMRTEDVDFDTFIESLRKNHKFVPYFIRRRGAS